MFPGDSRPLGVTGASALSGCPLACSTSWLVLLLFMLFVFVILMLAAAGCSRLFDVSSARCSMMWRGKISSWKQGQSDRGGEGGNDDDDTWVESGLPKTRSSRKPSAHEIPMLTRNLSSRQQGGGGGDEMGCDGVRGDHGIIIIIIGLSLLQSSDHGKQTQAQKKGGAWLENC